MIMHDGLPSSRAECAAARPILGEVRAVLAGLVADGRHEFQTMLASASVAAASLAIAAPDAPDSQVAVHELGRQIFLTSFIAGEASAIITIDFTSAMELAPRLKDLVVQKVCEEAMAGEEN